jgi:hypothetical protein
LLERSPVKVPFDSLDCEPVVVEERLPFSWKELPVSERDDPSVLGMEDRLELRGHEEDLPHPVVVVALSIFHEFAGDRIPKARRGIGSRRRTQEVGERRHREIDDEESPRRQVRANTGEKALYIVTHIEVKRRVERTHDEGKPSLKTDAAHVAAPKLDPGSNVRGFRDQSLAEVREHCRRVVHPRDVNAVARDGKGDPSVADAVLEDRPAKAHCNPDVELNIVNPLPIRRSIVVGVGVVGKRALFELTVTGTHGGARRSMALP